MLLGDFRLLVSYITYDDMRHMYDTRGVLLHVHVKSIVRANLEIFGKCDFDWKLY